jgi:hypothetical protein
MAYYKKGDKEKAKDALERALSLDSHFDGADEARGVLAGL